MAVLKRKLNLRKYADKLQSKEKDYSSHIAQEIYRKNVELAHTNQTLSLLRTIDGLVLVPDNTTSDLIKGVTTAIIANSSYVLCAIYMRKGVNDNHPMTLAGLALSNIEQNKDIDSGLFEDTKVQTNLDWFEEDGFIKTIDIGQRNQREFKSLFVNDTKALNGLISDLGCKTLCLVKLLASQKLVGLLVVGVAGKLENLSLSELEYLGRIGEATGIAIDNKLLYEENQHVLRQLERSNEKLKVLDATKDEFISMASHQLRTPLTSVKGYMSMVLDGDVGKLNTKQKQLLEQAYISSQRMVYLIADLLNVSRLHTGKFVIQREVTQLADVVEGELAQLTQTAKGKNISIEFEKPKKFPELMLDETKTRQVIMNFADNAIHYTQAGGVIKVTLLDRGDSIELLVSDNGIGVPKSEQHHLFTKFFRADNAKVARPDGTGLGLFMAKKVVIAQGGAIIFNSQEGKGSTFGFTFPKNDKNTVHKG